jgi:hypothetical protein
VRMYVDGRAYPLTLPQTERKRLLPHVTLFRRCRPTSTAPSPPSSAHLWTLGYLFKNAVVSNCSGERPTSPPRTEPERRLLIAARAPRRRRCSISCEHLANRPSTPLTNPRLFLLPPLDMACSAPGSLPPYFVKPAMQFQISAPRADSGKHCRHRPPRCCHCQMLPRCRRQACRPLLVPLSLSHFSR